MAENKGYHVAIVGATGAVGQQILETLIKRNFPISELTLLSSARSAGKKIAYKDEELTVQEAAPERFENVQIAFFSAGGSVSQALAEEAVKRGAYVVDNTSAFRMTEGVPLVVPEVNEDDLKENRGIIANPNCSTTQMVVALQPLREKYGLKKVVVSTYQAVSGAGAAAIEELHSQTAAILNSEQFEPKILPVGSDKKHYQIAYNAIPQIDLFTDNGFTLEEMKMINETKKILNDDTIHVAATCVRLPVVTGHSESVYVELEQDGVTAVDIQELLQSSPGITLQDNLQEQLYPMPADCVGKDDVFVGRIRKDLDSPTGFHLWIVSDNLLKGAALNTVQIAESLVKLNLVK